MFKRVFKIFFFILPVNLLASEQARGLLTGEAMADMVFAMDSVVDCGSYIFALSHLDGYRYFADLNAISKLDAFHHDEKHHSYSFDTHDDGVVHHKIILDWPGSEQYGVWFQEKKIEGKNRVFKSKCDTENYVRESIRDDHKLK